MATVEAKAKDRARKATPKARMEQAQWRAARRLEQRTQETHRVLQARAQRQEEALTSTGTWPATAVHIAAVQGSDPRVPSLPPAFAALHQDGCLAFVRDMYEALELVKWQTCVVCWRAWYEVPRTYQFNPPSAGISTRRTWFNFQSSTVLCAARRKDVDHWFVRADDAAGSRDEAMSFLINNYDDAVSQSIRNRLVDDSLRRDIVICSACGPHVEHHRLREPSDVRLCDYVVDPLWIQVRDQALPVVAERWCVHDEDKALPGALKPDSGTTTVLGRTLQEFAAPVAQLTDQEEMVLSLIHPLVQVYTLPRTGQLAYVGHVCNFRQNVVKFFHSLPILPADVPFVMVRPRSLRNRPSNRMPFKVNVDRLKAAFLWLQANNPYYVNIKWDDSAALAWSQDEIMVGVTREEDLLSDQPLAVTREEFARWMQEAEVQQDISDRGFSSGRRLLRLLAEQQPDATTDATPESHWSTMRTLAADLQGHRYIRMASSLPENLIAAVMHAHGVLQVDVPPATSTSSVASFLAGMPQTDWSEDLVVLYSELHTVRALLSADEPEVFLGGITAAPPGEDVGHREEILETMAAAVGRVRGQAGQGADASDDVGDVRTAAPAVGSAEVGDHDVEKQPSEVGSQEESCCEEGTARGQEEGSAPDFVSARPGSKQTKYPRVDPPPVEDEPGQAVREDTPGYIAQAFPKLFPHGAGDFHCLRGGMRKLLKFEEWGRFVLLWHDGRFIRHPRFRYWLLDTVLRTMTPGMQRTFFKTRSAATQYSLEDLLDPAIRKNLVSQMSTATSRLPGSVGERRKMRQELEAMVHQVEAETADAGENAGAGRIPAGFCTLTCPVYKWRQLFDTVLKSYPRGDSEDPQCGDYYRRWEQQPPGFARDAAMKKAFFQLAVANPGAVAWYCGLKLEMAVHLVANVLSDALQEPTTPGLSTVTARLAEQLRAKVGPHIDVQELPDLQHIGTVDDFYASFEWSDGGLVHVHIALWIVGAPRIDKVVVPKEDVEEGYVEVEVPIEGETVLPQEQAASMMSAFWERAYTEVNLAKAMSAVSVASGDQSHQDGEAFRALAEDTGPRIKLGRQVERERPSPESLSYMAMRHCLVDGLTDITTQQEQDCWDELDHILRACGRQAASGAPAFVQTSSPGLARDPSQRRAAARMAFVACLAEWVNMHDLHRPFPLGPPSREQPCCAVDQEHSSAEKFACNKLFPRKCISPGEEEIAEDPRRRQLFRLWLARNCHFINNYVPVVLMSMLSNMDFQATLTKDAVIEYMTKYMTKAGQGSLVSVMERSFSACIDKSFERQQGSGAAILRWFNLQSITEVKSQLETMHLLFGVPRFLCSRDFKDLWLRSEVRCAKRPDQITEGVSMQEPIVSKSGAEVYVQRHTWAIPSHQALLEHHPLTKVPWWQEILAAVRAPVSTGVSAAAPNTLTVGGAPVFDSGFSDVHRGEVQRAWPTYLRLLSWWQFKRFFRRSGSSIVCRPRADVVVVHPAGRFTRAKSPEQWRDACHWTLLAYCNHGVDCVSIFRDAQHLEMMEPGVVEQLMERFVMAPLQDRYNMGMTACPPHVRKSWLLGCARRAQEDARKQSVAVVTQALVKVPRFVFTDEGEPWRLARTVDMSEDDLATARRAWKEADALEFVDDDDASGDERQEADSGSKDRPCHPKERTTAVDASALQESDTGVKDRVRHPKEADALELVDHDASGDERQEADSGSKDRPCHPKEPTTALDANDLQESDTGVKDRARHPKLPDRLSTAVLKRMDYHMRSRLKWTHRELHDAVHIAGLDVPGRPSLLGYFRALHSQFGDPQVGFLPQSLHTHTKANLQSMLRCLSRTGVKLGGKLTDKKNVLAERVAFWLNQVVEAGREVPREDLDGEELSDHSDGEPCASKRFQGRVLLPDSRQIGDMPLDAVVTPEQAESALGHAQATEFDEDALECLDVELREEEEALAGRVVNPAAVDYALLVYDGNERESMAIFGWDESMAPSRSLTVQDFAFTAQQMEARFQEGVHALLAKYNDDLIGEGDVNTDSLDPTQLLAFELVTEWSSRRLFWLERQPLVAPPKFRMMLLGTAGTGKTHVAKLAIRKARRTFGSFHSVLTVAFSGVAAANLGDGARTIDSVFHTNSENAAEDLSGENLDRLVDRLRHVQLLVIDEVSTVGAPSFEIISRRLEQVGKVLWRERCGASGFARAQAEDLGGFGGVGVLIIGDFAQLPPVLSSSLLSEAPVLEGRSAGMRSLALAGRQTFQSFSTVVRLRRVHRLLGVDHYKESTLRLRDGAITLADYELWKTHQLETLEPQSNPALWPGAEGLLDNALVLVTDNAQAGRLNGKRLSTGVPLLSAPSIARAEQIVVRCCSRHNQDRARHLDASEFRNLRTVTHLRVGARVILTTNRLWATDTVPLGLMNGARGIVVAILFAPPGSQRRDGLDLAEVGFPDSAGVGLPRSLDQCPLPDVVIVHFPGYKGPRLLPGLPATWVPVPCVQQQSSRKRSLLRVGLPLKLAWALTIHKSQGITEQSGVVVSFEASRMVRAVSRMGLAFVAWTRTTAWEKMAFVALPPIEDFLAVRFSKEFRARVSFEVWADQSHDALLLSRGINEDEHIQEHQRHLQVFVRGHCQRDATVEELADVANMLRSRGVAPVSESVLKSGSEKGVRAGGGLWSIVASFRADKGAMVSKRLQPGGRGEGKGPRRSSRSNALDVVFSILREHGYEDERIRQSIELYGPDLEKCVDFCCQAADASDAADHSVATEEDWAAHVIRGLGFDETTTTVALESCDFSFSGALRMLLLGNDPERARHAGARVFRRHTTSRVYGISQDALSSDPVRIAYEQRARQDLNLETRAVDLGQFAGDTTAACFWLSLAAGLAYARWEVPSQALPALADASALLREVRELSVSDLDRRTTSLSLRVSPVGQLALLLRRYMCQAPGAALLRRSSVQMIFPAFAALDSQSDRRQLHHYKSWVNKLASKEYADELVVLATAQALHVEIVCVPYTPESAMAPWVISTYKPRGGEQHPRVLLGNNDVHYMWLSRQAP